MDPQHPNAPGGDPTDHGDLIAGEDDPFAAFAAPVKPWKPGAESLSSHMRRGPEVLSDTPSDPSVLTQAIEGLRGAAHPETASDFASLLIPSGISGAISGAKTAIRISATMMPRPTIASPLLRSAIQVR